MDKSKANITHRNDKEGTTSGKGMISPLGKTVPVVVLMAMNPALLNTAATMNSLQGEEGNPNMITMVSPSKTPETEEATYVMSPGVDETQQDYPLGVAYLSHEKIQKIIPCIESGVKGYIVFSKSNMRGADNEVQDVYIFPHNYKDNALHGKAPWIAAIKYHNLGKDSFMGAIVIANFPDGSYQQLEVRLDDDSAQEVVNLLIGKTQWVNKTQIRYKETNSPELMKARLF